MWTSHGLLKKNLLKAELFSKTTEIFWGRWRLEGYFRELNLDFYRFHNSLHPLLMTTIEN